MKFSCVLFVFVAMIGLTQANPVRVRREAADVYCIRHFEHFQKYCGDENFLATRDLLPKVVKFCPAYQKHCAVGKSGVVELPDLGSQLVLPPSIERASKFDRLLDLPMSDDKDIFTSNKFSPAKSTRLTAAIVATCNPDCVDPQCTDECKCAHTHPKVHATCNPPSSAAMAQTCQRWYAKCTMFSPVQY
ncbi:Protein CBG24198 [Caenorhabditis briggsae]|uniref:Protein CBR-OSM-11 n=2 Tax=Caenorhabditis briggsae TaxID=6238 RepID=A0AAE9D844_CAEBR|nr:Protein CBG24198 [Caenorhabditis briggsae]ULT98326.1 hypothetical protein L3Y34_000014 [Caenorhabditis briggsae]CAP20863.1 Protein CBG24198 [Caenorhabditis briggsae]